MSERKPTVATPITDKNGKKTTVHKKVDDPVVISRPVPSPVDPERAAAAQKMTEFMEKNYSHMKKDDYIKRTVDIISATPRELTIEEAIELTTPQAKKMEFYTPYWERIVMENKRFWTQFHPTDGVNYLDLDSEDRQLPWADRYKIMLAYTLAQHGDPVQPGDNTYGWRDDRFTRHIGRYASQGCSIAEVTSVLEDEWSEFENTFTDNSEHVGFQGNAQCACGWFKGRIRVEGTLGELIQKIQGNVSMDEIVDGSTYDERMAELNSRYKR